MIYIVFLVRIVGMSPHFVIMCVVMCSSNIVSLVDDAVFRK